MADDLTIPPRLPRGKGKRGWRPARQAKRRTVPAWVRKQCKGAGIDPAVVADVKAGLQEEQANSIIRRREMRQLAWHGMKANSPGCLPFWRHGFRAHYGRRVDAGDYTAIPGYDELFNDVANEFPEWRDRGEFAFFEELMSPCPRLPTAADCWSEALAIARQLAAEGALAANEENRMTNDEGEDETPF